MTDDPGGDVGSLRRKFGIFSKSSKSKTTTTKSKRVPSDGDSSADMDLETPGEMTPVAAPASTSSYQVQPTSPSISLTLPSYPASIITDTSSESSKQLEGHLENVKKSLDDVLGARHKADRRQTAPVPVSDSVPMESVRKLTTTVRSIGRCRGVC